MAAQEVDLNDPNQDTESSVQAEQDSEQKLGLGQRIAALISPIAQKFPALNALKGNKKALIALIGGGVSALVLIISLVVFAFSSSEEEDMPPPPPPKPAKISQAPQVEQLSKKGSIDESELGQMIKKANILYEQGDKLEALDLFEHIAIFSQSLAGYNLGVIKLKEKEYAQALQSFDLAIESGEDVAVSAINAAYAAHKLGKQNLVDYYVGISSSHLFESSKAPFYSFLYSLVDVYKGFYFESLSSLLNPNSKAYQAYNNRLAARVFTLFNDDYNALAALKKTPAKKDNLAIAQLHARVGEYKQARQYMYEYLNAFAKDPHALMSLQLIELKLGNFKESVSILNRMMRQDEKNPDLSLYPIRVKLKDELFDIHKAQENFWNRKFEHEQILGYKIVYYYAPFRVFDAKQGLGMIQEGGIHLKIDNIEFAKSALGEGSGIAKVNQNIALALREVNQNNIRKARDYMLKALRIYPNHAILHYNIGVLYAQVGDYDSAYTHFLRAYHLDSSDVLSGLFAVVAGRLTYRNVDRILSTISADFADISFESSEQKAFLLCFLRYLNNVPIEDFAWIGNAKKPIYHALKSAYGIAKRDPQMSMESFQKIQELYPKDVVANVMYELARFFRRDLKEVALELNELYYKRDLDMSSIYFGASLARELYIYTSFITGTLLSIEPELEKKLLSTNDNNAGILQVLGLLNIYSGHFEKAFVYYNTLIDDLKEDDPQTRFLGAVAALGAGRHENAVALLQISKMESVTNLESKFALGLLYQEAKNFKAARDHYEQVSSSDFVSEYFDFDIDTSPMLREYN
ncbi:tetratricopeptide repeat protein [uncultured Helicobacter sp.]|uniref:tetratricopeptide repeat protein n=1 Tax=uncultured Helicobacter sp. TaxID=175537 RepID=UPI0037530CDC